MAQQGSISPDKNIVDRTKPRRNSDVARAVREARERLSQQPGNPTFDREMLRLHAHAMRSGNAVLLLLIMAVTAGGYLLGMGLAVVAWAAVAIASYAVLAFLSRRVEQEAGSRIDLTAVRRTFLAAHGATGLCWAWLAGLGCHACEVGEFAVVKGAVLLIAIAATAILACTLRGALAITFVPALMVFAFLAARGGKPEDLVMAGLLGTAVPFFSHVAGHLHRSTLMLLSFRTEKDALIAELETANAISAEARRRAEEANLAKSRFLATMSHELRTPLNAILGFSEVMANEVLGPLENTTYRTYARDIHHSGRHLLDLINEILDISRIEAGRYPLSEEPVDLAAAIDESCHLIELKARNKNLSLVRHYEPDLPPVMADERAIRQIALNLLSNAVKFAPTGGEIVVKVGWTASGGQYISVRDNGPGIPADELPVVLSAFGQGSIAIKSAEQGTGLGLPIVQGLVALHQGKFELRSKLRHGTEAIAILPAERVRGKGEVPQRAYGAGSAA